MKKIVALVLCLALALSLCTVAFAATAYNVKSGELDGAFSGTTSKKWDKNVKLVGVSDNDTVTVYNLLDASNGSLKIDDVVISDAASADYALVDGTNVTYFVKDTDGAYVTTAKKVSTTADSVVEDEAKCGMIFLNDGTTTAGTLFEGADGKYYVRGTDTGVFVLVDGKMVEVTATDVEVKQTTAETAEKAQSDAQWYEIIHTLDVTYDDDANKVTKVECDACKVELTWKTSEEDALAAFGKGNFVKVTNGLDHEFDGYTKAIFYKSGSTTTSADKTETVESAKTFDAGIALYAGMALASVAGSAVVIGKKKEF